MTNTGDELIELSELFSKGGEVATDALITSIGEGAEEVMDEMGYLIESASTSLSDAIKNVDFEKLGINITDGLAGGIEEGTPEAEKASENLANKTIEAAEEALGVQSPSKVFEGIGTDVTDGLVLGISNGASKVINEMKKLAIDMLDPFKNIEADFNSIGRDAMAGLNSGLNDRRGSIMTTARNIASSVVSTMRSALQIQSPSRVTKEIGEDTGQGLADGIESKQQVVSATSEKMAESVATMMKDSIEEMNSDIETATKNHNKEIEQMKKRHTEDVETIRLRASGDKRALTRDEQIRIERMTEDHNEKILDMEERTAKEREKIVSDSARELVSIAEKYVDKQTWLGEMSIKEEVNFWYHMCLSLEEGTEEYEQALRNHQNAVKQLRNEMEKANEEYSNRMIEIDKNLVNETKKLNEEYERESKRIKDQMIGDIEKIESAYERSSKSIREQRDRDLKKTQDDYEKTSKNIREQLAKNTEKVKQDFEKASADINKKLTDDINKLNQEYENAHSKRVNELTNITGLFERYNKKTRVPEGHLIRSLESQVKALEEYSDVMGSLDERIDNEDLMNELKALGPDSLAELEALNRMSDEQLAEFVGLYEERFRLAKEQANKELEPMKKEIEHQMQEINIIAANELNILKENADIQLKELNKIANNELITLKVNTDNQLKEINRNADNELRILKANTEDQIREIRENAYEELEILKENTDEQLKELNKIAEEELAKLEKEWIAKIEDIVNGTEEEFDRLYDIGADAIRGLEEGMLSQESSLRRTAERIAESVSGTIRGALDINSPSRLMRDEVGKMIPAGIALGIKDNAHLINKEMMGLSRMIVATPEQALGLSGMRYNGADTVTHTNTISNDNSKVYNPVIKNYFTKDESTPSEVARKNKQQQQRLAMEWGF